MQCNLDPIKLIGDMSVKRENQLQSIKTPLRSAPWGKALGMVMVRDPNSIEAHSNGQNAIPKASVFKFLFICFFVFQIQFEVYRFGEISALF